MRNKSKKIKFGFLDSLKSHSVAILIGVLSTVVGGVILFWITSERKSLSEVESKLNCTLVINQIKNDSVYYNIYIKNIGKSTSRKIRYRYMIGDNQFSQSDFARQSLSVDESLNLFPIPTINPYFLQEDYFSINVFLFYESIWEDDTVSHKNKFTFFIPREQLTLGTFNPVNSLDNSEKIFDEKKLDSLAFINKLKQKDGSLTYVFYESSQNSLSFFFRFDSTALLYDPQSREIIFQKLFDNGNLLTIKKVVEKRAKDYHVVILNWIEYKFSLYVNGDSSSNNNWQKIQSLQKESFYKKEFSN